MLFQESIGEKFRSDINVILIAPKGMGPSVRRLYEQVRLISSLRASKHLPRAAPRLVELTTACTSPPPDRLDRAVRAAAPAGPWPQARACGFPGRRDDAGRVRARASTAPASTRPSPCTRTPPAGLSAAPRLVQNSASRCAFCLTHEIQHAAITLGTKRRASGRHRPVCLAPGQSIPHPHDG